MTDERKDRLLTVVTLLFASENGVEDEEELYDCVYSEDEAGEVYEDLMKVEAAPPTVRRQ